METTTQKLKSLKLYLSAHPDNEENSECADRLSDVQELLENETQLQKDKEELLEMLGFALNRFEEVLECVKHSEFDNELTEDVVPLMAEIESLIQKHKP